MMTVEQLISELQQFDGDREVRLAFQPNWPLQFHISEVVGDIDPANDMDIAKDDDGWYVEDVDEGPISGPFETDKLAMAELIKIADSKKDDSLNGVVWVSEGGQVYNRPYLPGPVSRALGWR